MQETEAKWTIASLAPRALNVRPKWVTVPKTGHSSYGGVERFADVGGCAAHSNTPPQSARTPIISTREFRRARARGFVNVSAGMRAVSRYSRVIFPRSTASRIQW